MAEEQKRIPDWLHLILSICLSLLALGLVYLLVFVSSHLVSRYVFAVDLTDRWIGILSIVLACIITIIWIHRRRARTEPVVWKRNLRLSANLILLILLTFIAFVAFKVFTDEIELPHLDSYLPSNTGFPADSTVTDSLSLEADSLQMEDTVMDSAHSSLDPELNEAIDSSSIAQ
ncbi:hypothetical protein [Croceimicrobium sp.]|uniref:hypothetical protein n=1 Tax=Croceimicrobium sp. TaxID=2828340 RepID=UPI003BAD530D